MDNNIPVSKSYKSKSGDLFVVYNTKDTRDELKDIVFSANNDIEMDVPTEKRPSISIVGLAKEYDKTEVIQMLVLQNGFIKGFASKNDINQHIKIFAVRPLKNNPNCFQVFANVSTKLREGFNYFNNRVTLGLSTCKVYDQYHIKRCNNCQNFGYYAADCPTLDIHVCGKCSSNHETRDCTSNVSKCINCVRNNFGDVSHYTNSSKCPSKMQKQASLKERLNLNRNQIRPPR